MITSEFWKNKRVFITGHTGFKGSWLCLLLHYLGAEICGYALQPHTNPSLFELANLSDFIPTTIADIRDLEKLKTELTDNRPEIVIHLAAKTIVRDSYSDPIETISSNIMGTVNLLEAVRKCKTVNTILVVTTDKVYENKEWAWGYRETDELGGYDPYSASKSCSEIIVNSFRRSFDDIPLISVARAGNVIGGGDWSKDRIIPDCVRAVANREPVVIRNIDSIRPWQYVLDCLCGYLLLIEKQYSGAWNFGPQIDDCRSVDWIVSKFREYFAGFRVRITSDNVKKETSILRLDSTKSRIILGWEPKLGIESALNETIEWYMAYFEKQEIKSFSLKQIENYLRS